MRVHSMYENKMVIGNFYAGLYFLSKGLSFTWKLRVLTKGRKWSGTGLYFLWNAHHSTINLQTGFWTYANESTFLALHIKIFNGNGNDLVGIRNQVQSTCPASCSRFIMENAFVHCDFDTVWKVINQYYFRYWLYQNTDQVAPILAVLF